MAGRLRYPASMTTVAQTPTAISLSSDAVTLASHDGAHHSQHVRPALDLLQASQSLQGQSHGIAARLGQEIAGITQGQAQLILRWQRQPRGQRQTAAISPAFSYPIRYNNCGYGTLNVAPNAADPEAPAFPLTLAHLLAEICGLLLYSIEQSALFRVQSQQLEPQPMEALTKREHEILSLICKGLSRCEIAEALSIAPRTLAKHYQHIYAKFGVHDERDALLVAFREGWVSFID